MAKPKVKGKTLLEKLEESLTKLIDDMDVKDEDAPKISLTDRMKVYDRVLKLEQLKSGIDDTGDTAGFGDD